MSIIIMRALKNVTKPTAKALFWEEAGDTKANLLLLLHSQWYRRASQWPVWLSQLCQKYRELIPFVV
jgi:hypothetical protein